MFALIYWEYTGRDGYTVFEKVKAVSKIPAKLIFLATGSADGWHYDSTTDGWWHGNQYMPTYTVEKILELT